jgi:hypothetical protein
MQRNIILVFLGLLAGVFLMACGSSKSEKKSETEAYKKAEETLYEKEQKDPANFLVINSKDKHNLIGQTVVKGTIDNKARMCVYYDIEIEFSYLSKTGTLLMKQSETIYETIAPGKQAKFKAKEFAPKDTEDVLLKIISAKTKPADPAT